MYNDSPVIARQAALALALWLPSFPRIRILRDPHVLLVSFLSWFPCVMRCDEQLWHMRQTTAFDP